MLLKNVLLQFHHYCHGPATQPRVRRSSFQSPCRCIPLQYQQYSGVLINALTDALKQLTCALTPLKKLMPQQDHLLLVFITKLHQNLHCKSQP